MRDISEKERRLIKFESYLDCRLPEDYRDFLLSYNGAELEKRYFPKYGIWLEEPVLIMTLRFVSKEGKAEDKPLYSGQDCYDFEGPLFWLTEDEHYSLLAQNKIWREGFVVNGGWWPEGKDYIVFAEMPNTGCYYCLGIRGEASGNVYFWTIEEGWSGQEKPHARSFTELLSLLRAKDSYIPEEKWPKNDESQ